MGARAYTIGNSVVFAASQFSPATAEGRKLIAHELTHLLQKPGLGTVPNGEVQCDIFALARSPLFTDDMPTYLPGLTCMKREWKLHAQAVREMCLEAIEIRKLRRTYIQWLTGTIEDYFTS